MQFRYSLGWAIMGPVSGGEESERCTVNLLQTTSNRAWQGNREGTTNENVVNPKDTGRLDEDRLLKRQLERP